MEEVLPPQTESGAGFESTAVRQFTIFMENRVGRLQTLVRGYEGHDGRILGLMVQNSADTALVRMICSDADLAREVFAREGFSFTEQELLVVMLPRRAAHPLLQISAALLAAEINIHYMYPLLISPKGPALALYVDDRVLASQLFIRKGFTLLAESDLEQMGGRGNSGENN